MCSQNLQPSSVESLEHRSLIHLKGFWKVVHHGNLITPIPPEKTPRLVIYFGKLRNQTAPVTSSDFETSGPAIACAVPAAELMRLPLNVVISNGRISGNPCAPLPSEEAGLLSVELNESKVRFFDRYACADDEYILPYKEGRTPSPNSAGGKTYYVAIEHNGDPYGIIVPCAEVFRFFYCTSSRMLYTFLSDRILDPDHFIIDPARSGIKESAPHIAVVWLRQWMLNSDRRHIARLFFTDGAFDESKKILLRAIGYENEGRFKHSLVALPPEHGQMDLKCIFKRIPSNSGERLFVTRLVSASTWKLPFSAIHFGRDNDARSVLTLEERNSLPDDERPQRPNVLVDGAEINLLGDESADNSVDPIELNDAEFESRFPGLDEIHSPQLDKPLQTTKNNHGKQQLQLEGGTLVEGSASTHERLVNVILQAIEQGEEIGHEESQAAENAALPLSELDFEDTKLHHSIAHLEQARVSSEYAGALAIEYLQILQNTALISGKLVNILPTSFEGKSPAFLFVDRANTVPKPVLVASLKYGQRVRYIIDFMHRDGRPSTAVLVLWYPEEKPLGNHLLNLAIRSCLRNRSINLSDAVLLMHYCAYPLRHTLGENSEAPECIRFIDRIFSAKNAMQKWAHDIERHSDS